MGRSKQREQAFFLTFESLFGGGSEETVSIYHENVEPVGDYARRLYEGVTETAVSLDEVIAQYLKGWKISRIPKVDLSILRIAVYEMLYVDDVPDSVAINEAVELAKKYAGKEDSSFINGILGSVSRSK